GDARSPYIPSVREDIAIGLAAGAWLGGRAPAVVMQNSGLGTSLNALVSLSLLYRLPALLLVTWRGHGGADAPEHILMGEISPALLDLIRIPHRVLTATGAAAELHWAKTESSRLSQPVALLVPPGLLETRAHEAGGMSRAPVEAGKADTSAPPPRPHGFRQRRVCLHGRAALAGAGHASRPRGGGGRLRADRLRDDGARDLPRRDRGPRERGAELPPRARDGGGQARAPDPLPARRDPRPLPARPRPLAVTTPPQRADRTHG